MKRSSRSSVIRAALLALLAVASLAAWHWALAPPDRLSISFLDVGQGDAIAILTPRGHTVLVDAGPSRSGDDAARRTVVPFLRSLGVNRVDALLLTHEDSDHTGGACTIVDRLRVAHVLGPAGDEHRERLREILSKSARRTPYGELAVGDVLRTDDGVEIDVLRPPSLPARSEYETENDTCLVLRVRYGSFAALLTGDMGFCGEEDLLASGVDIRAAVLKLGHHGSNGSSTMAFLRAVRPRIAIVSAGRHNVYGHPHPAVLARLAQLGVTVCRTDRQGTVTVETDGRAVAYRAMR